MYTVGHNITYAIQGCKTLEQPLCFVEEHLSNANFRTLGTIRFDGCTGRQVVVGDMGDLVEQSRKHVG